MAEYIVRAGKQEALITIRGFETGVTDYDQESGDRETDCDQEPENRKHLTAT
jgi:hypothetical protein